ARGRRRRDPARALRLAALGVRPRRPAHGARPRAERGAGAGGRPRADDAEAPRRGDAAGGAGAAARRSRSRRSLPGRTARRVAARPRGAGARAAPTVAGAARTGRARHAPRHAAPHRERLSPDRARLVLTLVEFVRQLMERQAIRRMEAGSLTPEETEDVGRALMRLEETIRDIGKRFGLAPEDLNLDLGPLGRLL